MSKLIDLTNETFGYWKVLYRANNDSRGKARWHCLCQACGTEKDVDGSHLRGGRTTNCGCIRLEKMHQAIIKNEAGKIYGHLQVIREATKEERPRQDRTGVYWVCKCLNCGKENVIVFGDYLRKGDTESCGCLNSKNESRIAQMLDELNIKYKKQYPYLDLYFDFAIYSKENELLYFIEYDGIQHFKNGCFKQATIKTTHHNDLIKNQYCFNNKIPIIRIPYNKKYEKDDLILETTKFLLTQENEKEYYSICEEY